MMFNEHKYTANLGILQRNVSNNTKSTTKSLSRQTL